MAKRGVAWKTRTGALWITGMLLVWGSWVMADPQAPQSFSADDLQLGAENTGHISVGRDLLLNGTRVHGHILAGRAVTGANCTIRGRLMAGRDINLNSCDFVENAIAGGNLILYNTGIQQHARAGGKLALVQATVRGNATAGGEVTLEDSDIQGTLSTASPRVVLKGATVRNLRIAQSGGQAGVGYNGIVVNGTLNGSTVISNHSRVVVGGQRGGAMAAVGPGSTSAINGYTMRASDTQTTVITPGNAIYVNGRKVTGDGPEAYAEYREQTPQAPQITGPGWPESQSGNLSRPGPSGSAPVVELTHRSTITGSVVFEGGHGTVRLHPGSQLNGTVEGGIIERLATE